MMPESRQLIFDCCRPVWYFGPYHVRPNNRGCCWRGRRLSVRRPAIYVGEACLALARFSTTRRTYFGSHGRLFSKMFALDGGVKTLDALGVGLGC